MDAEGLFRVRFPAEKSIIFGSEFGPRDPSSCVGLVLLCTLVVSQPRSSFLDPFRDTFWYADLFNRGKPTCCTPTAPTMPIPPGATLGVNGVAQQHFRKIRRPEARRVATLHGKS